MTTNYLSESLQRFLDDLAARQPVPGGGSTAALAGALGAAAAAMSVAYTLGNEKFPDVESQMRGLEAEFTRLRGALSELIAADIQAFQAYSDARALPRDSAAEKDARKRAQAEALELCTRVPELILNSALAGLQAVETLAKFGNPRMAGDTGVAAYFFEAAARGAAAQIVSNCSDETRARAAAARAQIAECQRLRETVDTLLFGANGLTA